MVRVLPGLSTALCLRRYEYVDALTYKDGLGKATASSDGCWFEFNDSRVEPLDASHLFSDETFGGQGGGNPHGSAQQSPLSDSAASHSGGGHTSAYMLFYDRLHPDPPASPPLPPTTLDLESASTAKAGTAQESELRLPLPGRVVRVPADTSPEVSGEGGEAPLPSPVREVLADNALLAMQQRLFSQTHMVFVLRLIEEQAWRHHPPPTVRCWA